MKTGAARRALWGLLTLGLLLGPGLSVAHAQASLEDYDYDNLRLTAIGPEVLWVNPKGMEGAVGFGARADLGMLGPYIRLVPRFAYWKAGVNSDEVRKLEEKIQETCAEPCEIDLGSIDRAAAVLALDAQWTLPESRIRPYLGVGVDLYLLNDSGSAIKGTFLDDSVITAGVSGAVGGEFDVTRNLRIFTELRGTLVTNATSWNLAGGVQFIL